MKNHLTSLKRLAVNNTSLLLICILSSYSLHAQNYNKRLSKADKNFKAFAYIDARAIYLDVVSKGYSSANLYSKLADSFYYTGDIEHSVEWYEKLIQTYPNGLNPEYLFKYAQSLKSVERYDDADRVMSQFYLVTGDDKRAKSFIEKRDYLSFIELQSGRFDLYTLDINSKKSEHAPSFTHLNQIVFASSRSKKSNDVEVHEWNKMPFLDIFSSEIGEDQITLEEPMKVKGKINTKFHESSTCFSKDGKTMYFSRNNYTNNKLKTDGKGVVLLKLYKATLQDKIWTNIIELPFSSNTYSVSHPSLSADGKKLYFASDMPGSLGKSDLFVVDILGNDTYGTPKNLGNKINTEGRETFPFISDNGMLYFASDGHVGLGGLDVFIAVPDEFGFSDIFNLGKPINSSKDDFSFILNEKTKTGYFSSNRSGGKGNDDIYGFKQTKELITSCNQYIEGIIINETSNETFSDANVVLLDENQNIISQIVSDSKGQYRFKIDCDKEYFVRARLDQFISKDIPVEKNTVFEFTHQINIPLSPNTLLITKVEINLGDDLSKILQLDPIYFDLDDASIRPESEVELQKIISAMNKYPELKIEVRSHTDSRSSHWYNKKLSVKRMRATVKYIIEKGGIHWRRTKGKAYGERQLINNCTDENPCTEEEHQENRRSEFIIWE
ncbi:OmpA family protein [Aquimarina longa]|uniref:OmpA family protein n=1 Tax=Aquimarina longa TaxID=1080221 RepID=UPI000A4DF266|nr:OmpA family protein [Aquimarina longa]